MLEIWRTWFGQSLSFPVLAMHLIYLFVGVLLGLALKKKKPALITLGSMAVLFAACALLTLTEHHVIYIYCIYLGGMFTLLFVGTLTGIIINRIRRRRNEKGT